MIKIINDICINNTKIELAKPLEIEILEVEDGSYIACLNDEDLYGYRNNDEFTFFSEGETIEEAIEQLNKEFDFLYKSYVCSPDNLLTEDTIQLKKNIQEIIGIDNSDIWIIPVRELSYKDAKNDIIEYRISFKHDADIIDLVEALWLDIELVIEIVEELDKEHQFRWI